LNCGSGVQLNENTATVFIIALPPVTFSQGFTVTVTDSDGKTYTVETDKSNEVIRSSLLVMPPVTLGASDEDEPEISGVDYIDEYGVNHGKGIEIDGVVWAPVNCGYHETDFKYGKLYQWGRKYGQGYDEEYTGIYDATYPTKENGKLVAGPVSISEGQSEANKDVFFYGYEKWWPVDTDYSVYRYLWNASGSTEEMIKSENDPCPQGWRVPTAQEHKNLIKNHSQWTTHDGQNGYWFSGSATYSEYVSCVFLPAAGLHYSNSDTACDRGDIGRYWSSSPYKDGAYYIAFTKGHTWYDYSYYRATGYSVRCVQVTD
jgi:uncharacterized protein (TIGR02145 family)